jgi:hypothetical protein
MAAWTGVAFCNVIAAAMRTTEKQSLIHKQRQLDMLHLRLIFPSSIDRSLTSSKALDKTSFIGRDDSCLVPAISEARPSEGELAAGQSLTVHEG